MTMKELLEYKAQQKKLNAAKWNKEGAGSISGFTQEEFNASMKDIKRKTSTTRRSHSRGNLWNHYNERIKADIEIIIG